MSHNHPKGFTLIELLVVVAIISILMGILLPSLSAARNNARRVVCLTRLREVGTASRVYAGNYGDTLPIPPTSTSGYDKTNYSWGAFDAGNAAAGRPKAYFNIGLLYSSEILTDARANWCPSQHMTGFSEDSFTMPFASVASQEYRSSYNYNAAATADASGYYRATYPKLQSLGDNRALAFDLIYDMASVAHTDTRTGAAQWNIVFGDAHADTASSAALVAQLTVTKVGNKWSRMNNYRNLIEKSVGGITAE